MSYIGNTPLYQAFVTDTFSGDGSTTAFTMSVAPANTASILVAVSGVLQAPSTYSINATALTFSAAPPTGTANISVRYLGIPASGVTTTAYSTRTEFTATNGQTTFSIPSYTAGFIEVYRNGALLGTADYTATSGTTVVLASGATAGDLVTTISFLVSSVLNAIPNTAGSVTNANLGAISSFKTPSANTITVPDVTGTVMVSGNMPAFSAYGNASQTVTASTFTKVTLNTEEFDTNNNFDSTTNYRFTPTVAGYYQINGQISFGTTSTLTRTLVIIYKNGSAYKYGLDIIGATLSGVRGSVSSVIYFNGSTDYVELYGFAGGVGTLTFNGASASDDYFNGVLVRSA